MNHDDRSDRDVSQRRRRRGASAAVLGAAAGAALAAAMIPAAPAFADPADDAVGAAGITTAPPPPPPPPSTELQTLDSHVITDADKVDPASASFDEGAINSFLSDFPGGENGAAATAEETFLVDNPGVLQGLVDTDTFIDRVFDLGGTFP